MYSSRFDDRWLTDQYRDGGIGWMWIGLLLCVVIGKGAGVWGVPSLSLDLGIHFINDVGGLELSNSKLMVLLVKVFTKIGMPPLRWSTKWRVPSF
jgi:hypothetical protein